MKRGAYIDLAGQVFNGIEITFLYSIGKWSCICHCGKEFICRSSHLKNGHTKSCGCINHKGRVTHGLSKTHEYKMWKEAKYRANKAGKPFNLEITDIVIPGVCPLLGILIAKSDKGLTDNSPSLDCFDPNKSYVKGNAWVISQKANTVKRDFTLEQWKVFVTKLEEHSGNRDCR